MFAQWVHCRRVLRYGERKPHSCRRFNATTFSAATGFVTATSTELTWGTTGGSGKTGGTLTGDPLSFSAGGTTTGLDLAELVMTVDNNPEIDTNSFNYNLVLNITTPSLGANTYVFPLSVSASSNRQQQHEHRYSIFCSPRSAWFSDRAQPSPRQWLRPDGFFAFDAINVSADSTSFLSGDWSVTGHQAGTADLFLTADVVLSSDNSQGTSVPEPASASSALGALWASAGCCCGAVAR